jgi:hypothetical protein
MMTTRSEVTTPAVVVILGGSTTAGSALAYRFAEQCVMRGDEVLWFDCVPPALDEPGDPLAPGVQRFRFGEQHQKRFAKRLESMLPPRLWLAKLVRRCNTATEGYSCWRTMRHGLRTHLSESPPEIIVFCDEFARTAAWHVARRFGSARIERATGA